MPATDLFTMFPMTESTAVLEPDVSDELLERPGTLRETHRNTTAAPRRVRRALGHAVVRLLMLSVVGMAVYDGLMLRRWAWDLAEPIHFTFDIHRGYGWGHAGSGPEGYLNLYEKMALQKQRWTLWLDYAPLRLAVMTGWGHLNRATQPNPQTWIADYAFNRPVLWFNAAMEGVGVLAAFFLVRRWTILGARPAPLQSWPGEWGDRLRRRPMAETNVAPHPPFRGWAGGLVAGLLLWFNPAMILSAHAWPTWDAWIVPMYLLGVLAGSYGRWSLAGVAIGVGVMFKGQVLVGAPVFLAWTLFNGDWRNAVRFACGSVVAVAAIVSPWMLTSVSPETLAEAYAAQDNIPSSYDFPKLVAERFWNTPAILWTLGVTLVAALLPLAARLRPRWQAAAWVVAAGVVLWPVAYRFDWTAATCTQAAFGLLALAVCFVRRRTDRVLLVLTSAAVAMLAGMSYFGASRAWWDCGIAYGTGHFPEMVMGFTDNLPGLLKERFGWRDINETMLTFTWGTDAAGRAVAYPISVRGVTRTLFVLSLLPCLWAVTRLARRGDPRFLVAVTAPWLMFFCWPTQIHDRYLIYAAAISAIWAGQSLGMAALGGLLTLATFKHHLHTMLTPDGRDVAFGPALHAWQPDWFTNTSGVTLHRLLTHTYPDLAWGILLAAMIVLYVSLTTTRRPVESTLD